MNKHFKELLFIILAVSPLIIMSVVSNLVQVPVDMSYEGIDRNMLLISNSVVLFLFIMPGFFIRNNKNYSMNYNKLSFSPLLLVIITTFLFIILNAPIMQ